MSSRTDILKKASLTGEEVRQLNFLSSSEKYHFRKYYRQGLRSHIFEVLSTNDLAKERQGEIVEGIRRFPRAVPQYMLRILRTRFSNVETAINEIKKYSVVFNYLGPDLIASSNEFVVEYTGAGKSEIVLCGLQVYVDGAILDPWVLLGETPLTTFYRSRFNKDQTHKDWMSSAFNSIQTFVCQTRKMIAETGYIPDLAGNGNLILTRAGRVKLVDINNILKVHQNESILIDDKGYPACDKSIEVLSILEQKILANMNVSNDPLYRLFLEESRVKKVKSLEEEFFRNPQHLSSS